MAFPFNPAPSFDAPVLITVPGQTEPAEMRVTWKFKGQKELAAFLAKPSELAKEGKTMSDGEYLSEILLAWDVVDGAGDPVPVTPMAIDDFIDKHYHAGGEFMSTYVAALSEARAKN